MKKKYTLRVPIEVTVTGYVGMHEEALLNALEGTIDEALTGVGDLLLDELSEYDEKDRGEVDFMSGGIFLEDPEVKTFDADHQGTVRYIDDVPAVHYAILAGDVPRPECRWAPQPGWALSADPTKVTCRNCLPAAEWDWKSLWCQPVSEMLPGGQLKLARAILWEREYQVPTRLVAP